ncbi:protein kinase domain-containing protein [Alloacidobacterium sp.]|uniref:protein kinase domain-containing protein n=1 Tax=Alloacidobacterium sp. TaxID=2951999 RepID=UPI002D2236AD|nr:protein kinase [Alloacidobacterium sp.]HYK37808.1 protein kinase [Alloacidobacterium sp.]
MVEDLLAQDAQAGSFLLHPPFDFFHKEMMNGASIAETPNSLGNKDASSTQAAVGTLPTGQELISRFVVIRFIAKGGMGEVYEVEDRFLQGVRVALKTILPHMADDPALNQRFEREVMLAREVVHPNLCPIYDIFHCDEPPNLLFLTMKLLPGETLAARFNRTGTIFAEEAAAILEQLVAGVAAIHAAGIIHRDIKPNNIMLDGSGRDVRLWITDFGLARAFETETTLPGRWTVVGTPAYMAPELFLGRPPTQASDLFALGVVLHEVFTGQKPAADRDNSSIAVSPQLKSAEVPAFCSRLITECLSEDPKRRCQAFDRALSAMGEKTSHGRANSLWSRRHFVGASISAVCLAGGAAWWDWEKIEDFLHPLPRKRFVALLNWPNTSDVHVTPMLTGVLNAIKSELVRAEAFDRDLFVISPEDVNSDITKAEDLKTVCDPLGANLALAASGIMGSRHFELILRLLDPVTGRPLRQKTLACAMAEITELPARAVEAATSLLNLTQYLKKSSDRTEPGTQSTAAFAVFQQAETMRKQPNDAGLNNAIEKYKEALDLDPRYAMAHAKLAQAYFRQYWIQRNPSALELARGNCDRALALEPGLVEGHLARSLVLEYTGDKQGALDEIAKALTLDPSDPKALLWQAEIYERLNRWSDAEKTYRRVLDERPNSWVIYNEFGTFLQEQGRFREAIQAFRDATTAAPGSALALSSLGTAYLQTGDFAAATESLKKSLALAPNADYAVVNISLALRYQGKYKDALPYALRAVQIDPGNDANWLELGDCYSSLPKRQDEARSAYLRAAKEAERHLQTDQTDGPSWMLLALYRVKLGDSQNALSLIQKAESLGAGDMDSQLYKARILEQIGRRDEALSTLAACFQKGASAWQITPFPDMQALRKDARYRQMVQSRATNPKDGDV